MSTIHIKVDNQYFEKFGYIINYSIEDKTFESCLYYNSLSDKFEYMDYINDDIELPNYRNYTEDQLFQEELIHSFHLNILQIKKIQETCTQNTIVTLSTFMGGYNIDY